jgi:DNA (cytosine-5)-methyltransferase 1
LVRLISDGESSSWPTATAGDAKSSGSRNLEGSKAHQGVSLTDAVRFGNSTTPRRWPTPTANQYAGSDPEVWEPRREREKAKGRNGNGFGLTLAQAVQDRQRWPTPTARDHKDGSYNPNVPINGLLGRAVWPTPQTADSWGLGKTSALSRIKSGKQFMLTHAVKFEPPSPTTTGPGPRSGETEASGQLNPTWVEWLMGLPLEWTVLEPSEMPSSRKSRKRSVE